MPALRAVLFDFFGTLTQAVSRGPGHADLARRLGCDPDRFAVALDHSFAVRARGGLGDPAQALRAVARSAGADPTDATARRVARDRIAVVADDIRLRAETVPTLRALRGTGLRLGLVSDCGPELPLLLPGLPLAGLLDATALSITERVCKPDPAIYLAACDRLGVTPQECLYVGDGDSRELTGALRLGMSVVQLASPDLGRHLVLDPDREFTGARATTLSAVPVLVSVIRHARSLIPA